MGITVEESTIKNTTKCKKGFTCLNGNRKLLCKVKISVRDEAIFVMCSDLDYCGYRIAYADLFVCNCPTRKEIYKRYNY